MKDELTQEYFSRKVSQRRKKVSNMGGKAFDAMEIANQVLRLCYPLREVRAVHCYYNNEEVEDFVRPEQGFIKDLPKDYVVVDMYYFFDDVYCAKSEKEAFVVEVVFPQHTQRVRWQIARVRWADLKWGLRGNFPGDEPLPQLVGETVVNYWM